MRATTVAVLFAVFAVLVGCWGGWLGSVSDGGVGSVSTGGSAAVTDQDSSGPRLAIVPRRGELVKDRSGIFNATIRIPDGYGQDLNLGLHVWTTGEGPVEITVPGRGSVPLPDRHYVPLYRHSPGTELAIGINISEAERTGDHSLHVELVYWNDEVQRRTHANATVEVVCPWDCQVREFCRWVSGNVSILIAFAALLVSILSLLFWLMGRKEVRVALGWDEK